ncbi:MAG: alkaline phosphatase [Saprospiraceae bacterium]|nr:MAG: alkaline phosphatase [Saprospiraceae bacterium]
MLGYSEMREVLLWVQTKEAAEVHFEYWEDSKPKVVHTTDKIQTNKQEAFTAKLIADQLEPGKTYEYRLHINGKLVELPYPMVFHTQPLWQWRTDPPPFRIALGSCAYTNEPKYDRPGTAYGGSNKIFQSIHAKKPNAMIWLGDNIYLREVDWFTRTGILHRYTQFRAIPELQPLMASANHYAIWDDHDFGPNDSDRSYIHKDKTLEAFKLFWGNPTFGVNGQPGITSFFQYHDIDFFLLDDRYYRSPNRRQTGEITLMGKNQLEWLIDALTTSQAPFKMVAIGGQVLNPSPTFENYANRHAAERQYLLRRIEEENIKGVVFLTGDRHATELSTYTNNAGNAVYDLTVSPLTSGAANNSAENNLMRVEKTYVSEQNFGVLEFTGPRKERKLTMHIYDADGKQIWNRTISAE